jgi:hypothetical protein
MPFLTDEFNNMRALIDGYLQMTKTHIDPNSLDNDPLDQKIRTCCTFAGLHGHGQPVHRRRFLPANSQMATKHRRRKFMSEMYQFAQS